MNTVTVIGRLGADPEVKYGDDGRAITSFSVADDQGKDKQGAERTNWFRCTAWGKTAEHIGNFFSKGSMIAVTGQLLAREFAGRDGVNRTSLDLTVDRFGFTGEAKRDAAQPQAAAPAQQRIDYAPAPQAQRPAPAPAPQQYGPPMQAPAPAPQQQYQLPPPAPGMAWAQGPNGYYQVPLQAPAGPTLAPGEVPF